MTFENDWHMAYRVKRLLFLCVLLIVLGGIIATVYPFAGRVVIFIGLLGAVLSLLCS